MKNILLISSILILVLACKKRECKDTYTISGRLFHNQNGVFEKDEPLKNWEVKFNLSRLKNFGGSSNTLLGSTYTDEYGNFSLTYSCDGNETESAESVEMYISSSSNIIRGISYILPINQNIHRDFTETSHARIVCEIDNQSDLDTLFIHFVTGEVFDSGNIDGIVKKNNNILAVPISSKNVKRIGYVTGLDNNLAKKSSREVRVSYSNSHEAVLNKEYLGNSTREGKGAPYYDTVRIELK